MTRRTVLSWDHAWFPLDEYGDAEDGFLVDLLPTELIGRLAAWSIRFGRAWSTETGFKDDESPVSLDREFRSLAEEIRQLGYNIDERPWWRGEEYRDQPWWPKVQ